MPSRPGGCVVGLDLCLLVPCFPAFSDLLMTHSLLADWFLFREVSPPVESVNQ